MMGHRVGNPQQKLTISSTGVPKAISKTSPLCRILFMWQLHLPVQNSQMMQRRQDEGSIGVQTSHMWAVQTWVPPFLGLPTPWTRFYIAWPWDVLLCLGFILPCAQHRWGRSSWVPSLQECCRSKVSTLAKDWHDIGWMEKLRCITLFTHSSTVDHTCLAWHRMKRGIQR